MNNYLALNQVEIVQCNSLTVQQTKMMNDKLKHIYNKYIR